MSRMKAKMFIELEDLLLFQEGGRIRFSTERSTNHQVEISVDPDQFKIEITSYVGGFIGPKPGQVFQSPFEPAPAEPQGPDPHLI